MPYNRKIKKCRGKKFELKTNGFKVNFKKFHYELKARWEYAND